MRFIIYLLDFFGSVDWNVRSESTAERKAVMPTLQLWESMTLKPLVIKELQVLCRRTS